jgi:hypothetical protein
MKVREGDTVSDFAVRRAMVLSAAGVLMPGVAQSDEKSLLPNSNEGITLIDPPDSQRTTHVRYSMRIKGKLSTPSAAGATDWDLNSSATFEFDQRRFASDSIGQFGFRAVRRFQQAETTSKVGKEHENEVSLPQQSRLVQVYGGELQLVQLSPDVRLTRSQIDLLQFPCDPLAVTGLLPDRSLKDAKEKWNADVWVVAMLSGIDAVVTQSATCELKSLSAEEAVVLFECQGTGAITGSSTTVSISGEMVIDRSQSVIKRLKAVLKEKRTPGTVSPGLDVEADIEWTQEIAKPVIDLPETMPDAMPDERRLLLTLATPWRVLLLHNRSWHVFHETSELVMLRMLHNGALLAQCNIASAPLMAAGKFTIEQDYVADVERAIKDRAGRIVASNVTPDQNGWRIHHVQAIGEANKKTLIWDYYLCSTKSGEQISLVFSHAEEDSRSFTGVPDQMLQSLTIRSVRPKIALPR